MTPLTPRTTPSWPSAPDRCTSIEEIAVKVRYLASLGCDLEPRQRDAFFWSILRGG